MPAMCASEALDERAGAEATAAAHRDEAVTATRPLELVEGLRDEETARAAQRVAESDCTAVRVGLFQVGTEFLFAAFAKKTGIDASKVKVVPAQATVEPLMAGKMDYFLGWVVNQTYAVEQESVKADAPPTVKGKTWRAIKLSDYGVRTYTDVIFTSGDTLKKNPELVKRYLRAVQKGMQYVIDHPDESVEILAKFPGQVEDAKKLAWRFKLQNPLFQSDYSKKNGPLTMDPAVWTDMINFLKDGDQIPKTIPVAEVMTNDYFVKK